MCYAWHAGCLEWNSVNPGGNEVVGDAACVAWQSTQLSKDSSLQASAKERMYEPRHYNTRPSNDLPSYLAFGIDTSLQSACVCNLHVLPYLWVHPTKHAPQGIVVNCHMDDTVTPLG